MRIIYLIVISLLFNTSSKAQSDSAVFRDYFNYEKGILNTLKESGAISTFKSMPELKKQAEQISENTLITANLLKAGTHKLSGEDIVEKNSEGTLMICQYSPKLIEDETVRIGATAILLNDDGLCVSNYHVFQDFIDPRIKLTPLDSIFFVATQNGKIYPIISILSYNRTGDITLFKIDLGNNQIPAIPVGKDLKAGANIHALTHPLQHLFYYSKGVVARNICTDENNPFSNRTEITADYARGSSGGPLFDDCGNLVGMVSTTQSVYAIEHPQTNLQMVVKAIIPISSILRLIRKKDKS